MAGLGDLVATLGVNSQPWSKGIATARGQWNSFKGGLASSIAPLAGMLGSIWGAKASVSAFNESLKSQRTLESVLTATGGAAGLTGQQIADYAGELQSLTNFEGDATVAAAAMLAAFTNVRGDVFKDTLAAAQDMTVVLGGDLPANVKLLGKALNDPVAGIAKLGKAGIQFTTDQQAQITALQKSGDLLGAQGVILDAVASKFGGAAKATADPMQQLSNTVGDVAENIGALLLPAITVGADALSGLFGTIVGGGETFVDLGVEAAVQLSHIGAQLVLAATKGELFALQIGGSIGHFFMEALPRYLDWFAANWQNIFVTVASNTLTVFENLGANIRNAMTAIWDYIASGGTKKLELSWTPLTTGFINTIEALPDIPDRVASDVEKSLAQSIIDQGDLLAESMQAQRDKLKSQFTPSGSADLAKTVAPEVDEFNAPPKEQAAKSSMNQLAMRGSAEAAKILLSGTGAKTQEKLLAKSVSVQEQMLAVLDRGMTLDVEEVT